MAKTSPRKLYTVRNQDPARVWVGEDKDGEMWVWPNEPKGWAKKKKFRGSVLKMRKAHPAEARGTGWHGGVGGGRRRLGGAEKGVPKVIRAAPDLWDAADVAAAKAEINLNEWVRRAMARDLDHRA